ncbi:DUF6933 domain-containing protein [Marinigracilibium pacificum]|uniref:DUF6933 domain-containing protein n=1 Tax=Marinigracilibium pacificum TaxID=2729599 RepID=A0A848J0P5_9BACT|nr:hypothetical protein [Marinigracilibium pacificum]NMM48120.1 hypothetical protein [Marinigracilibium pacificum]
MTNIYCTIKLEKLIGKGLISTEEISPSPIGNWNANLFSLNGRKCMILMNDISYYSLIFLDILKKDLINFQELFYHRLVDQFNYDNLNFSTDLSPTLLNTCKPNFIRTNNNRKVLGTMNEFIHDIKYLFHNEYNSNLKNIDINELNHNLTNNLVGALKPKQGDFGKPIEIMNILLQNMSDKL